MAVKARTGLYGGRVHSPARMKSHRLALPLCWTWAVTRRPSSFAATEARDRTVRPSKVAYRSLATPGACRHQSRKRHSTMSPGKLSGESPMAPLALSFDLPSAVPGRPGQRRGPDPKLAGRSQVELLVS